jgi:hypothetical protein
MVILVFSRMVVSDRDIVMGKFFSPKDFNKECRFQCCNRPKK